MAAVDGFNKTSQNDIVKAGVDLGAIILAMNAVPRVYQYVAMTNMDMQEPTWRIVLNDLITVNATLAEADVADYTSFTTSSTTITPAMYPVRSFISEELIQDAIIDAVSQGLANHVEAISNAVDANVLGNITSATSTSNHTGVALDKDKFEAALLAFKKQKPNDGEVAFVGAYKPVADVIGAYGNAGGAVYAAPGVVDAAVGGNPMSPFRGVVAGVKLFEGNVPSGGGDVNSCFLIGGKALAVGFRGQIIDYRLEPVNGRVGMDLLTYSRYGTGIANQANLREVISLQ